MNAIIANRIVLTEEEVENEMKKSESSPRYKVLDFLREQKLNNIIIQTIPQDQKSTEQYYHYVFCGFFEKEALDYIKTANEDLYNYLTSKREMRPHYADDLFSMIKCSIGRLNRKITENAHYELGYEDADLLDQAEKSIKRLYDFLLARDCEKIKQEAEIKKARKAINDIPVIVPKEKINSYLDDNFYTDDVILDTDGIIVPIEDIVKKKSVKETKNYSVEEIKFSKNLIVQIIRVLLEKKGIIVSEKDLLNEGFKEQNSYTPDEAEGLIKDNLKKRGINIPIKEFFPALKPLEELSRDESIKLYMHYRNQGRYTLSSIHEMRYEDPLEGKT